ncbi:unnamed protein product [Aphanomyces euteiches]|uniref:Uncharacterized protein n=1 Tax=Aphanomyces euteiches TaxID=100861 RepID=A0A6G0X9R1_9STRA|nr:hypothetical protein Ae201684_006995 [Aphanomyces euteiches]KAH9087277.1 hypothetical protein Ae201684P_000688 [Aphanomyces euteiches]KAH9133381.1 hypothetical protein AeRB84_020516 [Aphanomyces euteiches]
MGQCCSKRQDVHEIDESYEDKSIPSKVTLTVETTSSHVPFVSLDRQHLHSSSSYTRQSLETNNAVTLLNQDNNHEESSSSSSSPSKDMFASSITSSKNIYTSPPSSPSKSSQGFPEDEPQVDEVRAIEHQRDTIDTARQQDEPPVPSIYIRPEDRPIESAFIREERRRLALIQEQLRQERQAAHEQWVAELQEKKKEFLPTTSASNGFMTVN